MDQDFGPEINKYLDEKRVAWSPATYVSEKSRIKLLVDNGFPLSEPLDLLITLKKKYEPYSIHQLFVRASVLEAKVFGQDKFKKFIKDNPSTFRGVYLGRTHNPSPQDIIKILKTAHKHLPQVYNLLVLMSRAGLRKSEALRVMWIDINDEKEILMVRKGKGRKDRVVPFPKYLIKSLKKSKHPRVCGKYRNADRLIKKVREMSGVDFTPHALRGASLQLYSEVLTPSELKEFAGHSSFATTLKYLVFDKKRVADKIEKLIRRK